MSKVTVLESIQPALSASFYGPDAEAITDVAEHELIPSPGPGFAIVVYWINFVNSSAVATYADILNGSGGKAIFTARVGTLGSGGAGFQSPGIQLDEDKALVVQCRIATPAGAAPAYGTECQVNYKIIPV